MAIDSFAYIERKAGTWLPGESQRSPRPVPLVGDDPPASVAPIALSAWSLEVDQTITVGPSGQGAGKIKFQPLSVTKAVDDTTPTLFGLCASGTPIDQLQLLVAGTSGPAYLEFLLKDVAVMSTSWTPGSTAVEEDVVFDYGDLVISYSEQRPDGSFTPPVTDGWDAVTNTPDDGGPTTTPGGGGGGGGPTPAVPESSSAVDLPAAAAVVGAGVLAWRRWGQPGAPDEAGTGD